MAPPHFRPPGPLPPADMRFHYLTSDVGAPQSESYLDGNFSGTVKIFDVGAEITGRKLGIGLRLFAKAARRGVNAAAASSAAQKTAISSASYKPVSAGSSSSAAQAKSTAEALGRGTRNFGRAVLGPVAHTGGVLWLEVTGLFFGLFTLFFVQNVYRFRASWKIGPEHIHFLVYSALTLLFAVFTVSQFLKARRKEKTNRARRSTPGP